MSTRTRCRDHRALRATAALGLSVWTFACSTYAAPRAGRPLEAARQSRVHAAVPIPLSAPAGALTAVPLCQVTRIDGRLDRVAGDTFVFGRVDHVTPVVSPERHRSECPSFEGMVTLVRTAETRVQELRVSTGRTVVLALGVIALLLAIAAVGASAIEPGFPEASGGAF